eukprot:scaffold29327_cov45-Phaeocystis_antarctica.AAC.2
MGRMRSWIVAVPSEFQGGSTGCGFMSDLSPTILSTSIRAWSARPARSSRGDRIGGMSALGGGVTGGGVSGLSFMPPITSPRARARRCCRVRQTATRSATSSVKVMRARASRTGLDHGGSCRGGGGGGGGGGTGAGA